MPGRAGRGPCRRGPVVRAGRGVGSPAPGDRGDLRDPDRRRPRHRHRHRRCRRTAGGGVRGDRAGHQPRACRTRRAATCSARPSNSSTASRGRGRASSRAGCRCGRPAGSPNTPSPSPPTPPRGWTPRSARTPTAPPWPQVERLVAQAIERFDPQRAEAERDRAADGRCFHVAHQQVSFAGTPWSGASSTSPTPSTSTRPSPRVPGSSPSSAPTWPWTPAARWPPDCWRADSRRSTWRRGRHRASTAAAGAAAGAAGRRPLRPHHRGRWTTPRRWRTAART